MLLVQTKLAPPRLRAESIPRSRLLERLRDARQRRLILITGPAGYGKTTLAGAWRLDLIEKGWRVAWLALNRDDNEIARLAEYLVAALAESGVSGEALQAFQRDRGEDPGEGFVVALVSSIARLEAPLCLVLDDFQEMTSAAALRVIQQLVEYAPENFHLCLIARQRPALSLAKLRVGNEIGEIDVADLRFSEQETAKYVESRIGPLASTQMRKLYELTDGWVAALLLVELALGKHAQIAEFLSLRPASLRSFHEFLDAEVLAKLPPEEFTFLVRAAACRRINGPLCEALSGAPHAAAILDTLYERNLFLTEIDSRDRFRWYRFHPLLRQRLLEHFLGLSDADRAAVNRSACAWFSAHGYEDDAVRHAIYAGDVERAADLVEACARPLIYSGMFRRLIEWAGSLPSAIIARRLALQLSLGWAQAFNSRTEVTLETCRRIQSLIGAGDARSAYELDLLRCAVAVVEDDSDAAYSAVQDATRLPASAGTMLTGIRANMLSWSLAYRGDFDGARDACLSARFAASEEEAPVRRVIGESFYGMSLVLQGDMLAAERILREAFAMGTSLAGPHSEPASIAAGFLAEPLYELDKTAEVLALVGERADLIELISPLDVPLRGLTSLARAHRVRGSRDEAAAIVARLEEIAMINRHDRTLACALGEQITGYLDDGDQDGARATMRRLAQLAERYALEPSSARSEIPLVAGLKRIELELADGRPRPALALAGPLLTHCSAWRRHQLAARLTLLSVRAHLDLREVDSARAALCDALRLGRRRGLVRTFLDNGPKVMELLRMLPLTDAGDADLRDYAAALTGKEARDAALPPKSAPARPAAAAQMLTERELEIVGMLGRVLTNKKIARALGISDGTVKWHLKNIHSKLGVISRDEALARCRDLGLLG